MQKKERKGRVGRDGGVGTGWWWWIRVGRDGGGGEVEHQDRKFKRKLEGQTTRGPVGLHCSPGFCQIYSFISL